MEFVSAPVRAVSSWLFQIGFLLMATLDMGGIFLWLLHSRRVEGVGGGATLSAPSHFVPLLLPWRSSELSAHSPDAIGFFLLILWLFLLVMG